MKKSLLLLLGLVVFGGLVMTTACSTDDHDHDHDDDSSMSDDDSSM